MQNLNQFQEAFELYLHSNRFENKPQELYEPANYILSLGGKRLRPATLLASYYLFEDEVRRSLPAAMAVEVFHNFSLVHDDIMDAAPLRRGQPTIHQKFGLNAGILSGDAMLVLAFDFLLKTESDRLVDLIKIFTKMAVEVCEGQQMDMNFETQKDVSIQEYLRMIELKTAVLVGSSFQLGALIGGASKEDAQLLYDFGRNLGIAFQLQDDLLDAFGDPKKFGKKPGGDIIQKKKTYLYLKTLEMAPKETAIRFEEIYNTDNADEATKIAQVLSLFEEFDIRNLTERKKEDYWQESLQSLRSVSAPESRKLLLENFAVALMNREF